MGQLPLERLTRREREIMNAVFACSNRATAEEVRLRLTNPPTSSAARTMLARLEAKGYLRHKEDDGRYIYSATTSLATAQRTALRQYLRTYFRGSRDDMITALLRDEPWTPAELDRLRAMVDETRKTRTTK